MDEETTDLDLDLEMIPHGHALRVPHYGKSHISRTIAISDEMDHLAKCKSVAARAVFTGVSCHRLRRMLHVGHGGTAKSKCKLCMKSTKGQTKATAWRRRACHSDTD